MHCRQTDHVCMCKIVTRFFPPTVFLPASFISLQQAICDVAALLKHFLPAFVMSCLGLACFYRRIDLNYVLAFHEI